MGGNVSKYDTLGCVKRFAEKFTAAEDDLPAECWEKFVQDFSDNSSQNGIS